MIKKLWQDRKQILKSGTVGTFSVIIEVSILWWFADNLGYKAWVVGAIYAPAQFIIRFYINKHWVFHDAQ